LSVLGALNQLDIAGDVLSDADIVGGVRQSRGDLSRYVSLMNRGER
jgi:hypothetical protein